MTDKEKKSSENISENNTEFNAFMEKAYEKYTKDLKEVGDDLYFEQNHLVYIDWIDQLSWEELCDYADLWKSIDTEVNDNYVGQYVIQ